MHSTKFSPIKYILTIFKVSNLLFSYNGDNLKFLTNHRNAANL